MNDFQIISKLGEGAYSIVHKVKRLVDGNIYALKKVKLLNLSEKEKLNALNEVRILASVKSSFVISYKEAFFDENESCLCIVMEYAEKGDLYQKICEFKKAASYFDEVDIWRIFVQLTKGLKALHDLKILHRDLKSANVFLFADGSAALGDLNVSKVARRGLGYTQTGTPYYASPEVWKDQPYDSKSDIWSLGCVLYEMITLRPPFRAENMEGLYNRVIKGQYNKISDRFSSDLSDIVKALIQVQPESRPNCDQLLRHPIIQKRLDFFKANGDDTYESSLLQTIRIPKNLLFLTDRLPGANYEKIPTKKNKSFQNNSLPDVKVKPNSKQKKKERESRKQDRNGNEEYKNIKGSVDANLNKDGMIIGEIENVNKNIRNVISLQPNRNEDIDLLKKKLRKDEKSVEGEREHSMVNNIKIVRPEVDGGYNMIKESKDVHLPNLPNIKGVGSVNYEIKYDPSHKRNPTNGQKKGKYEDKHSKYIKQLEKYYDYNVYKPKKNIADMSPNYGQKVIPNRKLSPIGRKQHLIKI